MREEGADTNTGGTGLWLAGVVVVGVLVAGIYITLNRNAGPSPEELAAVVAPDTAAPAATDAEPETAEPVTEAAPSEEDVSVAATPEAAPQIAPTVDEVRLEGDGLTVIAGRAEPGAQVSVRVDGEEVATAVADARGAFAAVGVVAPSDAARVLTLEAQGTGDAVASNEDVILAPVAPQVAEAVPTDADAAESAAAETAASEEAPTPTGESDVAEAETVTDAPDRGDETAAVAPAEEAAPAEQDTVAALAPDTATESPDPGAAPQDESAGTTEPAGDLALGAQSDPAAPAEAQAEQSVTVLKSTAEGVEVLQPPAPEAMTSVAIDTIGYSDAGDVQLSGRAVLGTSEVRVYLNNRFSAALPVDNEGGWRGNLPEVDAGIYQLRVDEVNAAGDVTSRIETPFKREAPAVLAEADDQGEGPVRAITVQTGDTLWAIARDRYGEGVLYVKVFEANRGDIRDPDLIYPGQVFDLPVE